MLPQHRIWLTLLIPFLLLAGCVGDGDQKTNTPTTTTYTGADDGKTVEVAKGATFDVRLESNPSTGYSWKLDNLDTTKLKLVQDGEYSAGDCPSGTTGCSGTTTYRFEAIGAGNPQIKLDHMAPGSDSAEESFTLRVTITG